MNTWSFLGALWHWIKKGKEGKRKQRSSRERQDQAATSVFFAGIDLHVYFLARFGMHGIACGSFVVMAWVLPGVTVFST